MKKLILPLLAFVCLSQQLFAQTNACTVYSFTLQFVSATPSTVSGKSDVRVNLSWEASANGGNKFMYFNIWEADKYVAFNYSSPSNPPKSADLSAALGTIVIQSPSATTPTLSTVYNPDKTYTKILGLSGATLKRTPVSGTVDRFTVSNLLLPGVVTDENNQYDFKGDIWSSQQSGGTNVQCSVQESSFLVNEVVDRSFINCSAPTNVVNPRIQSSNPSVTGTYQIYVDNNTPGVFDEATDAKLGSEQSFTTSSTANVGGAWPYNFIGESLTIPAQYQGKNLWIVVYPTGISKQVFPLANSCAVIGILPVTFSSFTAVREKQNVRIKWQTATEENAAVFQVQRKTNGDWLAVNSVPAKNSASGGLYEVTDVNTFGGISQYRIVETDLDSKQKMTEIRTVAGEGAGSKLSVYPNPSTTGRVNLVFDNNKQRDISVIDMNGRVVKQVVGEASATVVLDIAQDGFYQVQITDRLTGETISEKIIVKKR